MFLLLQACLGLDVQADPPLVCLDRPHLPPYMGELRIDNLQIGTGSVDLLFQSRDDEVNVHVCRRDTDIEVRILKDANH